jgi:hypothetical protein
MMFRAATVAAPWMTVSGTSSYFIPEIGTFRLFMMRDICIIPNMSDLK